MSGELFFTACSRDTQDTFNRNSLHLLHCNAAHHLVDMTMGVDNDDEGSDADSVPSDRAVQNENELFTIYPILSQPAGVAMCLYEAAIRAHLICCGDYTYLISCF